jgi:general secretion pathway protein I
MLIEVLVALAVVAVSLASIGAVVATTSRGTRLLEARVARLEMARVVVAALPDRDQLVLGSSSGEIAGHRWRLDVAALEGTEGAAGGGSIGGPTGGEVSSGAASAVAPWVPLTVTATVQSPTGGVLQISTVRLQRRRSQ